VLTATGQSLLQDARGILDSVNVLRAKPAAIDEGLEFEVSMVVTAICPTHILIELGQAFQAKFPAVPLRIQTEIMDDGKEIKQELVYVGVPTISCKDFR
jgi:DNA-binding transcriptional LysR family regulator